MVLESQTITGRASAVPRLTLCAPWAVFPLPHSWATSCSHTSVPLFRESKELADLARLHPTSCAPNGLNPNLMVTGGPTLAGSGRWSADPAAHLAAHPWLPRSGSTSMWLAGHPYGEYHFTGGSSPQREGWDQLNLSQLPRRGGVVTPVPSQLAFFRVLWDSQGRSRTVVLLWAWDLLTLM